MLRVSFKMINWPSINYIKEGAVQCGKRRGNLGLRELGKLS